MKYVQFNWKIDSINYTPLEKYRWFSNTFLATNLTIFTNIIS